MGAACCAGEDGGGGAQLSELKAAPPEKIDYGQEAEQTSEYTMVIDFRLPDGSCQKSSFTRRPLGLDIDKKMPMTTMRVRDGSAGQAAGVEVGWVIEAIQGQSIEGMDFKDAYEVLKKASADLAEQSP
uniref:PDZ domain-containing protein n=1 Tax=Strombidinopsis acuminata TaxID=141414 RepID=A0A7S3SGP6_9SPIT|mmetsp:Transcript_31766/g.43016  ORF Transcript_31766/g.43016 Transcript_31766/m.43016 type:complete len:128 (+) Transcript_31766:111-494(+)